MSHVAYSAVHSAQDAARAALTRATARLFCFLSGQRSVQLTLKAVVSRRCRASGDLLGLSTRDATEQLCLQRLNYSLKSKVFF